MDGPPEGLLWPTMACTFLTTFSLLYVTEMVGYSTVAFYALHVKGKVGRHIAVTTHSTGTEATGAGCLSHVQYKPPSYMGIFDDMYLDLGTR